MKEKMKRIFPIYYKETVSADRTSRMTLTVLLFNFLLGVIGLFQLWRMVRECGINGTMVYSDMLLIYRLVALFEIILLFLLIPAFTAGGISGERERQTLDLLLCTRMNPSDILLGKLLSALSTVFVLVCSSLPMLSLVYVYGGIGLEDIFVLILVMMFSAFYIGSISIAFSSVTRKTTTAMVLSYLTEFVLLVGPVMVMTFFYKMETIFFFGGVEGDFHSLFGGEWLCLWSPGYSFFSMFRHQIGKLGEYSYTNYAYPWLYPEFLEENWWLPVSLAVQGITAWICLFLGSRSLRVGVFWEKKGKRDKRVKSERRD